MTRPDPLADREVAAFLEAAAGGTYSDLAAACLARFGADRAWDAETIRRWQIGRAKPSRNRIDQDRALRAFIMDRLGLTTVAGMLAAIAAAFPADRVPSRSGLHRFMLRERGRQLAADLRRRGASRREGRTGR